jgi:hypothetical protein
LLETFGSFVEVMHAPEARLREVKRIGDTPINQLKLIAKTGMPASPTPGIDVRCQQPTPFDRRPSDYNNVEKYRLWQPNNSINVTRFLPIRSQEYPGKIRRLLLAALPCLNAILFHFLRRLD